jgi:hypothetical protein
MTHPLDGFKVRASIDFITIGRDLEIPLRDSATARKHLPQFDGTLCLPKRSAGDHNHAWMTVHDPTKRDLQTLIDGFYEAMVEGLEVSVDFTRPGGASPAENESLYRWLRHSLCPQTHMEMTQLRRRQYSPKAKKYMRLKGLDWLDNLHACVWEEKRSWMQTRLYIKPPDDDGRVLRPYPIVRIEATLKNAGGTQNVGVHRVGLLPEFIAEIRRCLLPMLSVGNGFQRGTFDIRPDRLKDATRRRAAQRKLERRNLTLAQRWATHGAAAVVKDGLKVSADRKANALIGASLSKLMERIGPLSPPGKVADYVTWADQRRREYPPLFSAGRPRSYRGKPF